jgi:hypothetical protein
MEKEPTPEQQAFLREADRIAHQSKKAQARWLQELEGRLSQHPNRKAILKAVKKYLLAQKQKADATARLSHVEDQLAAKIIEEFEGLIQSKFSFPGDERARLKYLAKLTTLGHLIPDVKERLARPDAQEYLEQILKDYLK